MPIGRRAQRVSTVSAPADIDIGYITHSNRAIPGVRRPVTIRVRTAYSIAAT